MFSFLLVLFSLFCSVAVINSVCFPGHLFYSFRLIYSAIKPYSVFFISVIVLFSSVCSLKLLLLLFSHNIMSSSLRPHGLQHTRLPHPSLSSGVCWNSCPLSRLCYVSISTPATPFSFCPLSFPASGSFPVSWLFASGGKVLELKLQHQSFPWIFRVDFL